MRALLTVVLITISVSLSAQADTLRFWNGEYMVVRNDSVIYPAAFIREQSTEFPGGSPALLQFIATNLKLPVEVRQQKVYGRVDAIFYVDKTGMPTRITVRGDTTLRRGEEARRLVRSMPRWKPAIQNGKTVQMRVLVPVGFTVEGARRRN